VDEWEDLVAPEGTALLVRAVGQGGPARTDARALIEAVRGLAPVANQPTVRNALQDALELAMANVPEIGGQVVVCPDISGSMSSPLTGHRKGSTTRRARPPEMRGRG